MEKYLFGNREVFAIELYNIYKYKDYIYGKIFYWIQGTKLGKNEECIISDAVHSLKWMIFDNGNRSHELFYTLNKEKVFFYLSGRAFFSDSGEIQEKIQEKANLESWARFNITIDLVTLNDIDIFLIEGDKYSRIVYSFENEEINEMYIQNGYVEKVLFEVDSLLNEIY
ncbi:MAG: immunity 42 family protein [Lachnospiraceae bacterium]|nr:immunity 42 family protein [Lachnospiraceae bacterium]